jgi:uncharacterized SAM-binding protein YcdF (DUF218 family)
VSVDQAPPDPPPPSPARGLWRRWFGAFIVLLALLWLAGLVLFARSVAGFPPDPPGTTDAIVVLTGGSDRLAEGLRLLAEHRARKLFVSGVYHGVDVAELLKASRQDPQEVECCIALGYSADNTEGNARETADWLKAQGFTSLRLVTASYHMPRSLLEFRHVMPDILLVPHPVVPETFKQDDWFMWPGTLSLMISEYHKYLLALIRHGLPTTPGENPA